ncbi:OBAP family protein [Noviherbaspirillum pedocola]|uniref:OBAP family protein n=1 Tax=Noviherbaspirillum pedocola TaxID=2801341 RepID=A0A934STQ3_9BURK|nr:OBAP family protein [Noviherbaspirillum pedocola]MBK4735036.1 OBAP family protein [Noviherbaspirillum pedocola]
MTTFRRRIHCASTAIAATLIALPAAQAQDSGEPKTAVSGEAKTARTGALEAGAKLLQRKAPMRGFDVYLVGFHPMKDHPEIQMEAHHYCHQVNEDFAQCVLFDGNTAKANMNGVEYIISEKLFNTLPEGERQYWHPHNGEILSGQLVAPGIPKSAEKSLMKQKMNSYGKTWHFWNSGMEGQAGDKLPMGEPMLAWSFNRDGELLPGMLEKRDRAFGIDTEAARSARASLQPLAKPQAGVDDLKGKFGRATKDIPGVVDMKAGATPR